MTNNKNQFKNFEGHEHEIKELTELTPLKVKNYFDEKELHLDLSKFINLESFSSEHY